MKKQNKKTGGNGAPGIKEVSLDLSAPALALLEKIAKREHLTHDQVIDRAVRLYGPELLAQSESPTKTETAAQAAETSEPSATVFFMFDTTEWNAPRSLACVKGSSFHLWV